MSSEREIESRTLKRYLERQLESEKKNESFDGDRFEDALDAIMLVGQKKFTL